MTAERHTCNIRQFALWKNIWSQLYPQSVMFKENWRSKAQFLIWSLLCHVELMHKMIKLTLTHSIFTRALGLTGLELATSRTQSERCFNWANVTAWDLFVSDTCSLQRSACRYINAKRTDISFLHFVVHFFFICNKM